jgi:hypothetical protein
MLSVWLVELFLNKINLLEEQWNASKQASEMVRSPTSSTSQNSDAISVDSRHLEEELELAITELKDFFSAYKVQGFFLGSLIQSLIQTSYEHRVGPPPSFNSLRAYSKSRTNRRIPAFCGIKPRLGETCRPLGLKGKLGQSPRRFKSTVQCGSLLQARYGVAIEFS